MDQAAFCSNALAAVKEFQADAGLSNQDGVVTSLIMKRLLNTDPYVLSSNGDSQIRQIQQYLNNNYKAYTGLMPTNGVYVAQTNKALIYALQAEEGLSSKAARYDINYLFKVYSTTSKSGKRSSLAYSSSLMLRSFSSAVLPRAGIVNAHQVDFIVRQHLTAPFPRPGRALFFYVPC